MVTSPGLPDNLRQISCQLNGKSRTITLPNPPLSTLTELEAYLRKEYPGWLRIEAGCCDELYWGGPVFERVARLKGARPGHAIKSPAAALIHAMFPPCRVLHRGQAPVRHSP